MSKAALNIKNQRTHGLARELAARRGTSLTKAVTDALEEALERTPKPGTAKLTRLLEISERSADLPLLDNRSADAILGYDDSGVPA